MSARRKPPESGAAENAPDSPSVLSLSESLAGVKIVDMSTVLAGPFATHLLCDHGAEIVKVEPLTGDIGRRAGRGVPPGMGPVFQHINRGKRSVSLDLKDGRSKAALESLLRDADAFVFNNRPESMARLGLAYEDVRTLNPRIIYCGIVGFGSTGPYGGLAAYDDLIQGTTGLSDLLGRSVGDNIPRYVPLAVADRVAGLYAATTLLSALIGRRRSGIGCAIEVPMFEVMAHFILVEHMFHRSFDPPIGQAINPRTVDPTRRPYRTRDGFLCVLPYTDRNWKDLFAVTNHEHLASDPRFGDFNSRMLNAPDLHAFLSEQLPERSTEEWLDLFRSLDIPAARLNSVEELLKDPHLEEVGFYTRSSISGFEDVRFVGMRAPVVWNGETKVGVKAAPTLGKDTSDFVDQTSRTSR